MEPKTTVSLDVQYTPDGRLRDHEHIEQFFTYAHLPPAMQEVSRPFGELAARIIDTLPRNDERKKSLDRLLDAKDAAVRAAIAK